MHFITDEEIDEAADMELVNALERIRAVGPERVVVNRDGVAVLPGVAAANGILPDVVFIRNDGWTLGAPAHLESVACQLWLRFWMAKYVVSTDQIVRLDDETRRV